MLESRQLAWPAYLVSAAMILMPLADAMTSLYPWNIGDPRWRFGAVGLVSSALLIPIVGILVAYVSATVLGHLRFRTVIGILGFVGAALGIAAIVVFALDALQTKASVRPEMVPSFNVASITAALKTLVASLTLLSFGIAARRGRKAASKNQSNIPLFTGGPAAKPNG